MKMKKRIVQRVVAGLCLASMLSGTIAVNAAEPDAAAEPKETASNWTVTLEDAEHGALAFADSKKAEETFEAGDTVTVTLTADKGYEAAGISITQTETGEEVCKEESKDNQYSFTMPETDLTITASFAVASDASEEDGINEDAMKEINHVHELAMDKAEAQIEKLEKNSRVSALSVAKASSRKLETGDTVQMVRGDKLIYSAYNTYQYKVNGNEAYCVEPGKDAPNTGSFPVIDAYTIDGAGNGATPIRNLKAAMWFSYGSPGFDKDMWPDTYYDGTKMTADKYRIASHLLCAKTFTNDSSVIREGTSAAFYNWYFTQITGDYNSDPSVNRNNMWNRIVYDGLWKEVPDSFQIFFIYPPGGREQLLCIWDYTPNGYVHLTKSSANTSITNGNACYSLEGATYGVYTDKACKDQVGTLTTDAKGSTNTIEVEEGKYYVKETKAPKGYYEDTKVYAIEVVGDQTTEVKVSDVPGNDPMAISLTKLDSETGESSPQGGASLAGAQFTINYYDGYYTEDNLPEEPTRTWVIETKELKNPNTGEIRYSAVLNNNYKVSGDDFYYLSGNTDATLPLGTITVEETKAPEGYLLEGAYLQANGSEEKIEGKYVSQIKLGDNTASLQGGNEYSMSDQVIRGDVEFTKLDSETQKAMAGVEFEITSVTTGESHRIMTDENGYFSSASAFNPHTQDTNGGKATSGLWFGDSEPNDDHGAFPYDTYTIKEIEGKNNEGKVMYEGTFVVSRDNFLLDMGSVENRDEPVISTKAKNEVSGNHYALAEDQVIIIDEIHFYGLTAGEEYTVSGVLMNKETGQSLLDKDGNPITAEKTFTAYAPSGVVEVEFVFDGSELAGNSVVAFEELYCDGKLIADHKDIDDPDQTVNFPEIKTEAQDSDTKTDLSKADEEITIQDTVTYKNLKPGYKFTMRGTLMNKETGEPILDDNGKEVTAETTFIPEEADGSVVVEFKFSGVNCAGMTAVAFEELVRNDIVYAVHADIEDEAQTVHIPEIETHAKDVENQTQNSMADESVTVQDEVTYTNLVPGREYEITGTLYDKETEKPLLVDGKEVTATKTFTPEEPDGSIVLEFTFDGSALEGTTVVAFEELFYEGKSIAVHADINDKDQSIYFPEIRTTATDKEDGDKRATADSDVTIVDKVLYENLVPGTAYRVEGTLMLKDTEKALIVDGKEVTVSKVFTPDKSSGSVEVEFHFNGKGLGGKDLVAFEKLYLDGEANMEVAHHEDINDPSQTVTMVNPPAGSNKVQTGDNYLLYGALGAAAGLLIGGGLLFRKKKGPKSE